MFISASKRGYRRDGQQWAKGQFLILMTPMASNDKENDSKETIEAWRARTKEPMHGAVLTGVKLEQCGHFMMGAAEVKVGESTYAISLSGSYGGDGLPRMVPRAVYNLGVLLPEDLHKQWNEGGGHNSAGSEAPSMVEWAKKLPKIGKGTR